MSLIKRILLIADGLADEGCSELQGRTPLAWARHDALNRMASQCCAMTCTIAPYEIPGTERGVPKLLGINPDSLGCRASLEALALGISPRLFRWMARCNLCSLSEDSHIAVLAHDGDGVSDNETREALEALQKDRTLTELLAPWQGKILAGQGFRHFLGGQAAGPSIESGPHDGLTSALPEKPPQYWLHFVEQASKILSDLPLNEIRRREKRPLLNGFWPWNGGLTGTSLQKTDTRTQPFLCLSATPVMRGIALSLGMEAPLVHGATGDVTTDWRQKATLALSSEAPVAVIHLEAPDEASHRRSVKDKLAALEIVDQTVAFLMAASSLTPLRLMAAIDHGTSVTTGRHLSSPVPWALWDSRYPNGTSGRFVEHDAIPCDAMTLWPLLLSDEIPDSRLLAKLRCHCGF